MTETLEDPSGMYAAFNDRGVTVTVAVTGVVPLFTAANGAIFPVPFAGRPIDGVLLVQLKPLPVPVKLTAVVDAPAFTV